VHTSHLGTYLNDHVAGAVSALELIEHIIQGHAGMSIGQTLVDLKPEIEADRRELERIVTRITGGESATRKMVGWLGERVAQLKLRTDDPADGSFRLFESLEIISLGVEGKRSLWHVLSTIASDVSEFEGIDFDRLIARSIEQRAIVERLRLEAANAALVAKSPAATLT
jgi:hypothetical protein